MVQACRLQGKDVCRQVKAGGLAFVALLLAGCSTTDSFGGRTSHFNVETADSKSRSILTNVMRAAYGEPLIFSDVSTVTGQGTASATLGASLPVSVSPSTATSTYLLNPSATVGGQSSFNVTNLNTQEFYQGIQTPISLPQIQNLIDAGYDPDLVLFLAVSDVTVDRPHSGLRGTSPTVDHLYFHASAASPEGFAAFVDALRHLAEAGFSTQPGRGAAYGPKLTARQVADSRTVAAILGSTSTELGLKNLEHGVFQFERKGAASVCFDRARARDDRKLPKPPGTRAEIDAGFGVDVDVHAAFPLVLGYYQDPVAGKTPDPGLTVWVDAAHTCGYQAPKGAPTPAVSSFDVKLKTRSLEGVIQFLGAVARAQTGLADGSYGQRYSSTNDTRVEPDADRYQFRVRSAPPSAGFTSTELHGRRFYVASDPTGRDRSTRVLQIITDLLALQSSAKNIPAPNVISILGR